MALVNDSKKEINAKIVYMGPKGSGKGSSLRYIYSKLKPEYRSELKLIPAGSHQMLFFDFIYPQGSGSSGYKLRFHLYTLIAGDNAPLPWKMLLKGVDGLVFMADTKPERPAENFDNATLLRESLADYAMDLSGIPLSLQANCIDMKSGPAVSRLLAELFPENGGDGLLVNTSTGEGVLEGLHKLIKSVLAKLGQSTDGVEDSVATVKEDRFCGASAQSSDKGACKGERYCIETAGETVCDKDGIISVPLRLVDASGESSELLTLKISLSL
jgi:hypothetical protein